MDRDTHISIGIRSRCLKMRKIILILAIMIPLILILGIYKSTHNVILNKRTYDDLKNDNSYYVKLFLQTVPEDIEWIDVMISIRNGFYFRALISLENLELFLSRREHKYSIVHNVSEFDYFEQKITRIDNSIQGVYYDEKYGKLTFIYDIDNNLLYVRGFM